MNSPAILWANCSQSILQGFAFIMNQLDAGLIFSDDRINTIDSTLAKGINASIIHCYADETGQNGRTVRVNGKELINCVSCGYFGLQTDPRIGDAVAKAAIKYGTNCSVSRTYLSAGIYTEFEDLLDQIYAPSFSLSTQSVTLGHFSLLSVMIQPGDIVLLDQQVHASVQMAATTIANKAKIHIVQHNNIKHLRRSLIHHSNNEQTNNIWYLGDGIYSMFGDFAPVADLLELLDEFPNFYCYLDDAHGTSVFGEKGVGYVLSQCTPQHPKLIVAVSCAKCFGMGCGGALIFPNEEWRRKVRTCGSTMIFSGPIATPMIAAGIASAKIHLSNELATMQSDIQNLLVYFATGAADLGLPVISQKKSPIQYILVGSHEDALCVARRVMDNGFLVNCCAYPAVPRQRCGIRLTITRNLNKEDISAVLLSISDAIKSIKQQGA